ncbi:MAG: 2-hydroxyacid dehydrogenase [Xanthobacteraceae bacterium]
MSGDKVDVLFVGPAKPVILDGLADAFTVHRLVEAPEPESFLAAIADKIRGIAISYMVPGVNGEFMARLPRLEIVSTFGVGYDHVDAAWAGRHGIIVTNTPEVLTDEVADTALGLLLCTLRELPQAERYLRAGRWPEAPYPLTKTTLRNRTIGMVGMGRIGKAIARRLDGFGAPVVYHTRRHQPDLPYRYFPDLITMAQAVDTLMVIVPGGPETRHLINAKVLEALGPEGILINIARGSVVDEAALIKALQDRTIYSAGLDVFANEPAVPPELLAMDHVVLLPHVASGSVYTRARMDQLVVDNLLSWFDGKGPLTPVPETPWPPLRT